MIGYFYKRSWTLRPAPLFYAIYLLCVGLLIACGEERPENAELLARVGDVEISATDLLAFEAGGEKALDQVQHLRNLQILVDREILLLAANEQDWAQDKGILTELDRRETKALADAMLQRYVKEKAVVSEQEIEKAYLQQGWGEQVVTIEIFVKTREQARMGRDFEEVGREFAVDPYYGVLTGESKRMAYSPFDGPQAVVEAVFALDQGKVTAAISMHGGYVIAKVAERRQAALVEVEEGIRATLLKEKQKQLRQSYLRHLKWDLGTDFNAEGMELVVGALKGETPWKTMGDLQRHMSVYAFEGFEMDVEEVIEAVRPSGDLWLQASTDAVNEKLAESHFPNKIMAHDARRKGLHETAAFASSRASALGNLLLMKLREHVLAEASEPSEEDLAAFYEQHKRRFRSAAWAELEEILVDDPATARDLLAQLEAGADFPTLANAHTQRRKAKNGRIYVSQSQAPVLGEAWMNAVMNAELNQLSGPIQSKGGYSIFRVIEMHPEVYHTLDDEQVRYKVTRDVRERLEREHFNAYVRDLRKKYATQIEVFEQHLQLLPDGAVSVNN
ncbi:MAG TPA: peptidyl-prolyl cis-trans isomerase [Candidatus Latescibacteria bacterium]|nr:peptidyl-prolyl cis-trans isomerase [Candidatus Latescibacterota bacterium]